MQTVLPRVQWHIQLATPGLYDHLTVLQGKYACQRLVAISPKKFMHNKIGIPVQRHCGTDYFIIFGISHFILLVELSPIFESWRWSVGARKLDFLCCSRTKNQNRHISVVVHCVYIVCPPISLYTPCYCQITNKPNHPNIQYNNNLLTTTKQLYSSLPNTQPTNNNNNNKHSSCLSSCSLPITTTTRQGPSTDSISSLHL